MTSARPWLTGPSRMAGLLRQLPDAVVVVDRDATILWVSNAAARLAGYGPDDLVGRNGLEIVDPEDVETAASALVRTFESAGAKEPWSLRVVTADGARRWVEMQPANLLDDPAVSAVVISVRALDVRQSLAAEAREMEDLFRRSFDAAAIGMALVTPDGLVRRVNDALCDLVERDRLDLLGGELVALVHADEAPAERALLGSLLDGSRPSYVRTTRLLLPDGGSMAATLGASVVLDGSGAPERVVVHVARALAPPPPSRDPATGLPTAAVFEDRLEVALARTGRTTTSVAVLRLVVDAAVVEGVAAAVATALRPGDTLARLGAAELGVLCDDVVDQRDVDALEARIRSATGVPLRIGRVLASGAATTAEVLVRALPSSSG